MPEYISALNISASHRYVGTLLFYVATLHLNFCSYALVRVRKIYNIIHLNAQKTNPEKVSGNILLFSETKTIMEVEFQVERLFCTDSCDKKRKIFQ